MNNFFSLSDTICAIATAPGGALGIVRISGSGAISAASAIFSRPLQDVPSHKAVFGIIGQGLDEVLVTVFRAPHSYTGEDSVEISCHGSSYILGEVLDLLLHHGCRLAAPGEFTRRAFANGRMDLSQAEAVADVIASTNAASHRVAMQQMRGGISHELAQMRDQLLHLTSLLELELDFSDHEDLEFADRSELSALTDRLMKRIAALADSFRAGNAIKNGIPVAIIGAPNVGKSTLLNAILQEDRAIVSDIRGTTRDLIEDTVTLGPHTFRFIDTAGIRHTDDTIESLGIERSLQAAERAQIILLMTEPGVPFPDVPLRDDQCVIRLVNKSDLTAIMPDDDALPISARHAIGLTTLHDRLIAIATRLTHTDAGIVVTNARHHTALCAARDSLQRVCDALSLGISGDLIAQDLREVLFHLAEITGGEITSDEILGNIFKHFCIGK